MLAGGAEVQIAALAQHYVEHGHVVGILNLSGKTQLAIDTRIQTFDLGLRPRFASVVRAVFRARRTILAWRPDVVHSHMLKANLFARLVRLVCPMPALVCTAHSIREGGRAWMWLYRLSDRWCDVTTHVSREAVDHFVRCGAVPASRIRLMPNGVDLRRFSHQREHRSSMRSQLRLREGQWVWLHVGRLAAPKAQHRLLAAFDRLREHRPDAYLLVAGEGPLDGDLQSLAAQLNLQDNVRFLGFRDDVPLLMEAADGFVLSSEYEGSPMVLAEAGASGLPIVTTSVSGAAALVGDYGRCVPPGDHEALAAAMLDVIVRSESTPSDQALALRGARRSHVAREFGLNIVGARWLDMYRSLAGQDPTGAPT